MRYILSDRVAGGSDYDCMDIEIFPLDVRVFSDA